MQPVYRTGLTANGVVLKPPMTTLEEKFNSTFEPAPQRGNPTRIVTRMGNKAVNGPFAPLVRVAREIVGVKKFNLLRGKAIALHSNVIKDFCTNVGTNRKVAQGVIRLAKKNGENLGFLA